MNSKTLSYMVATVVGVALALGTFWVLQDRTAPAAEVPQAWSQEAVLLSPVPEVDLVHEGPREAIPLDYQGPIHIKTYASPTCGCCGFWADHMREHGFEVEEEHRADMGQVKVALGVDVRISSCHTAVVNGYVIEGHVPAQDVRRLLAEAPQVRGLTVPGMPLGSPGMEMPTGEEDDYQVLTFTAAGDLGVFSQHGPSFSGTASDVAVD